MSGDENHIISVEDTFRLAGIINRKASGEDHDEEESALIKGLLASPRIPASLRRNLADIFPAEWNETSFVFEPHDGYETIEDWARDSDYHQVSGEWYDDAYGGPYDLAEQFDIAMTAKEEAEHAFSGSSTQDAVGMVAIEQYETHAELLMHCFLSEVENDVPPPMVAFLVREETPDDRIRVTPYSRAAASEDDDIPSMLASMPTHPAGSIIAIGTFADATRQNLSPTGEHVGQPEDITIMVSASVNQGWFGTTSTNDGSEPEVITEAPEGRIPDAIRAAFAANGTELP